MEFGWFHVKCAALSLVLMALFYQATVHWNVHQNQEGSISDTSEHIFPAGEEPDLPVKNDTSVKATALPHSSSPTTLTSATPADSGPLPVPSPRPPDGQLPCWRRLMGKGTVVPHEQWIPPEGCQVREYTPEEVRRCRRDRAEVLPGAMDLWFFGDSRVRYFHYWSLERLFITHFSDKKQWFDLHHHLDKPLINVDFYWDQLLDEDLEGKLKEILKKPAMRRPGFIIATATLWYFRNYAPTAYESYHKRLDVLYPLMTKVAEETDVKVVWLMQDEQYDKLKPAVQRNKPITFWNKDVTAFNEYAEKLFSNTSVIVMHSMREQAQVWQDHLNGNNCNHAGPIVNTAKALLMLNIYCQQVEEEKRKKLNEEKVRAIPKIVKQEETKSDSGYCLWGICLPADINRAVINRTVVNHGVEDNSSTDTSMHAALPEPPGLEQLGTVGLFFLCALYYFITLIRMDKHNPGDCDSIKERALAHLSFGIILIYFLLCDRYKIFSSEEKHFDLILFLSSLFVLLGIGTWNCSPVEKGGLMNRDHTDEWKGWMQLVILIYHFTGASQVLPIYFHLRVIVSSYLFLSGYGHFCYYYNKQDFGFYRFAQVVFRMNFLTVVLCLVMARPYQFYYFVPLVTFWYILLYLTMALGIRLPLPTKGDPPDVEGQKSKTVSDTRRKICLGVTFLGLFVVISAAWFSPESFEAIFGAFAWRWLFATSDGSLHEWYFRWSLDRYSTFYGVIVAACVMAASKFDRLQKLQSRHVIMIVLPAALTALLSYEIFELHFDSKPAYNFFHPVITIVPILSFIAIRHAISLISNHYSHFFAAVGKISLELFIGQYHIWLADDTHRTLVLVPGIPVINICVTTVIFVAVAHQIHHVTSIIASVLIPKELKVAMRNGFLMAVLVVIYALFGQFLP